MCWSTGLAALNQIYPSCPRSVPRALPPRPCASPAPSQAPRWGRPRGVSSRSEGEASGVGDVSQPVLRKKVLDVMSLAPLVEMLPRGEDGLTDEWVIPWCLSGTYCCHAGTFRAWPQ